MTTGYRISDGTDLDALFTSSPGDRSPIGYKRSDGYDLNTLFHPYTTGAKRAATGYRTSAGVDFADLWQNSAVPLGAIVSPPTWSDDSGGGYYISTELTSALAALRLKLDGTWMVTFDGSWPSDSGNWWSAAPTANVGLGKYVKWDLLSTGGSTNGTSWTTSSGWIEMNLANGRGPSVGASTYLGLHRYRWAWYTVYVSSDGVNVHAQKNIYLEASATEV